MRSWRNVRRAAVAVVAAAVAAAVAAVPAPDALAQGPVPAAGSAGCGRAEQQPGVSVQQTIVSGGRERGFVLHVPADYDPDEAMPVVLAFHGHGSTGGRIDSFSKLSTLPAITVFPEGLVAAGDAGRQSWQGAPYAVPGVDDVRFTADLLDHLQGLLCVDASRIYATGISNGGGFTGLLACALADRIAAVAAVAGAFYPATSADCHPSRPIPVLEIHGTADATVPYDGGVRELPAIPDWVAGWAERNGCAERAPEQRIEPDIAVTEWRGCAAGVEVEHVAVEGGGHTWPGADSDSGDGPTSQTIETHELAWNFLSRFQVADLA